MEILGDLVNQLTCHMMTIFIGKMSFFLYQTNPTTDNKTMMIRHFIFLH